MNEKVKALMAQGMSRRTAYRLAKVGGRTIRPEVKKLIDKGYTPRCAYRKAISHAADQPRKEIETEDGYNYSKGQWV